MQVQGVAFSSQPVIVKRRGRGNSGECISPGEKSSERQRESSPMMSGIGAD